jgi:GAF domain-containing protein/biotin carboxyl carrier protein
VHPDPEDVAAPADDLRAEVTRLRLLHEISLEFSSTLDFDQLLPKVFDRVLSAVGAQGGSIWIAEGDALRCKLAVGAASQKLVGTDVPLGTGFVGDVARKQRTTMVTNAMQDPRFQMRTNRMSGFVTTTVMATPMVAEGMVVGSIEVTNKVTGDGVFDDNDRQVLEGLAASAAVALRNAQLHGAEKRARDLALLLEISREITSTLDLDRVLQSVVNLASRALTFDQAAVGLLVKGQCEIRAIAGEDTVDPKAERTQRLAAWGEWVARRGEPFYLSDRDAPGDDAEAAFTQAFGADLEAEDLRSGLYLPLKDEQGVLGVVMFESRQPDSIGGSQRELAEILANQTTVALRNAELYSQVPMVDMLGALAARKRALLEMPRRRLQLYAVAAVLALAALTLVRWPMRVGGSAPVFRAAGFAQVRALVPGVVAQVFVREGTRVARGAPLAKLRDAELSAERASALAGAAGAEQLAAAAASRADVAEERMFRARAAAQRQDVALLEEEIAATTVRAPVDGVVLTPRPEERIGTSLEAGDSVVALGRTDTLELELGVPQREIGRVATGQRVRIRVDALPQRTFEGIVTFIGPVPRDTADGVTFPVRASVPNAEGLLRPGMAAHAKVLTAPASVAVRVLRGPVRWVRLLWWRLWA